MNTRIKVNSAFILSLVILLNGCSKPPEAEETTKEESSANTSAELIYHKNVGPEDAKKLIDSDDPPVILDIRTPFEVKAGSIDGSTNINYYGDSFKEEVGKMDRNKPVIVHCRSGGRSTESLEIFRELGFKNVYHLDGGIMAWEKAGFALIKPVP